MKAARNSAIACGCLLAVIEGVGIGFQRMMAENTRLDVSLPAAKIVFPVHAFKITDNRPGTTTPTSSTSGRNRSNGDVSLVFSIFVTYDFSVFVGYDISTLPVVEYHIYAVKMSLRGCNLCGIGAYVEMGRV